jgi:hypothetical protein
MPTNYAHAKGYPNRPWAARVCRYGVRYHLGYFATYNEALEAEREFVKANPIATKAKGWFVNGNRPTTAIPDQARQEAVARKSQTKRSGVPPRLLFIERRSPTG